jgi:hypothetical protein
MSVRARTRKVLFEKNKHMICPTIMLNNVTVCSKLNIYDPQNGINNVRSCYGVIVDFNQIENSLFDIDDLKDELGNQIINKINDYSDKKPKITDDILNDLFFKYLINPVGLIKQFPLTYKDRIDFLIMDSKFDLQNFQTHKIVGLSINVDMVNSEIHMHDIFFSIISYLYFYFYNTCKINNYKLVIYNMSLTAKLYYPENMNSYCGVLIRLAFKDIDNNIIKPY